MHIYNRVLSLINPSQVAVVVIHPITDTPIASDQVVAVAIQWCATMQLHLISDVDVSESFFSPPYPPCADNVVENDSCKYSVPAYLVILCQSIATRTVIHFIPFPPYPSRIMDHVTVKNHWYPGNVSYCSRPSNRLLSLYPFDQDIVAASFIRMLRVMDPSNSAHSKNMISTLPRFVPRRMRRHE